MASATGPVNAGNSAAALMNGQPRNPGAGTGHGTGSQGSLQITRDGRYLLAVDAGRNQISVLRVDGDGSLQAVKGGPVASGGLEPVSIAARGGNNNPGLVYVANAGTGGSNYTGFTLGEGGHLRALPASTVALPDGSQPGDVLFNGDARSWPGRVSGRRWSTASSSATTVSSALRRDRRSRPRDRARSARNSVPPTPLSCS